MNFNIRYAGLISNLVEDQFWATDACRELHDLLRQVTDCQLLAQFDDAFGPAVFAAIDAGVTVGCRAAWASKTNSLLCARQEATQALFAGDGPCREFLDLLTSITDRELLTRSVNEFGRTLAVLTGAGVAVGLRMAVRKAESS